ncbi:MAG: DUF2332 family protein, partial [Symploca sp. SIO1C4]|nr:DUF2332 family protein [Symploca sp. SIO1C4]
MSDFMTELHRRFQKQAEFSQGYSPLYARLFGLLAEWTAVSHHPVTRWLAEVGADRQPFDVPLLLLAGFHRELLTAPQGLALANYYPSIGGTLSPEHPDLPAALMA